MFVAVCRKGDGVKQALVFLIGGPVLSALLSIYVLKIDMPVWQLLALGLIPSASGLWTDWQQKAFSLGKRVWASWASGAFGGIVIAGIAHARELPIEAYSMIFVGAAVVFFCCLLSAEWGEFKQNGGAQ
jgi:hypothetical protein